MSLTGTGEKRIKDYYRGLAGGAVSTVDETRMDSRDSEDLAVPGNNVVYTDNSTNTSYEVTDTDNRKLFIGLIAIVVLVAISGIL